MRNIHGEDLAARLTHQVKTIEIEQTAGLYAVRTNPACQRMVAGPKIGTCGFGLAKARYAQSFSYVEVQHTFYQPPRLSTLERWRAEMPADFEFTLKAWQLITHDSKSPTYRRLKKKLTDSEKHQAGYFRSNEIVMEGWETTRAAASALRAKTILFQCPASFRQSIENITNLEQFFSSIDRRNLNLCWEPRGDWDSGLVRSICNALDLWHVVDPFVCKTTTTERCYFRLHGRNGWRYQYEPHELEELASSLPKHTDCYVFFNNSKMTEDALAFCNLLRSLD
jgi:uncharacterized protein YecE (DUF72 family)